MNKLVIVFVISFYALLSYAQDSQFEMPFQKALVAFQSLQFDEMVDVLEKAEFQKSEDQALQAYMLGLGYNRVEEYQKAINSFGKAQLLKIKKDDIFYEMGQAYYALNELKVSKEFFVKSYNSGFKKIASLYYLGHISQLLGEEKQAKSYYLEISKSPGADINLKQIANYQLAEIIYLKFEGSNYLIKRVLRRYVFPLLDEALSVDPNSDLAQEISNRKQQLIAQFKMDTFVMNNGREVSKRQFMLNGSLEAKYDDNVTYAADNPALSSSTKLSSIYSDATVSASYNFIPNKYLLLTPSVKVKHQKYYSNEASVYSNDGSTIESKLLASIEHLVFDRPASLVVGVGYDYRKKDYLEEKSPAFYGETYTGEIAEKIRIFGEGDSQFRVQYKNYRAYTETLDTNSLVFDFYQTFLIMNRHYFVTSLIYEITSSDVASNESTSSTLSLNYFMPKFYKRLDMTLSYALSKTDTDLKGSEISHSPSIEFAQNVGKNWQLSCSFLYSKNAADQEAYSYSKMVSTIGLRYTY